MRAILLVKDKEGLKEDRLQNARYGLSGKPALTKQGIAGSLNASFKSSQQVSAANLRSLTDKLQEAQKALAGANNNLDKTDEIQDEMDEDKDKIQQAFSSSAWEQLFQGRITPFKFYSIKFEEDIFNESMAGEPGNVVQSIGDANNNYLQYTPLPRFPYYDPIMKWNWSEVRNPARSFGESLKNDLSFNLNNNNNEALIPFLDSEFYESYAKGEAVVGLIQTIKSYFELLTILDAIVAGIRLLATVKRPSAAKKIIFHTALDTAIMLILKLLIELIDRVVNAKIYSFSGYNYSNAVSSNLCYTYNANLITVFANFYDNIQSTVRRVMDIIQATYIAIHTSTLAVLVTGTMLSYIPFPPGISAVGEAMITGAMAVYNITTAAYYPAIIIPTIQMVQRIIDMSASRTLEGHSGDRITSESNWNLGTLKDYTAVLQYDGSTFENTMSKVIFTLAEIKYWLNFVVPGIAIPSVGGLFIDTGVKYDYSCENKDYKFKLDFEGYKERREWQEGDVTHVGLSPGILYPLSLNDGWWPIEKININVNDTVSGIIDAEIYDPANPTLVNFKYGNSTEKYAPIHYRSFVYEGDYFGKNRGIELIKDKTIYRTVFVITKWIGYVGFDAIFTLNAREFGNFYSCAALVATSPTPDSPLQLLWERSAIYNSYSNTPHAEQMIYNYDVNNLPSNFLTNNRTGKLQYAYFERINPTDNSSWKIIYRNVKSKFTNVLENSNINNEFTFGPLTTLTGSPNVPGAWGNLESYRWNP